MKNILILSPDSPVNSMGGLGVHLREVLNRIDTSLYNVYAVCQGTQNMILQDGKVKIFGLYEEKRSFEEDAYVNTFINQSKFISLVNTLINNEEIQVPDVVHIMDWTTAIAGEELAKQFNAKIVFSVHLSINNYINKIHPLQEINHRFATDLEFNVCRKADKIIHVTKHYSTLFPFNVFEWKTDVVHNGVDYKSFSNAKTDYSFPGNNKIKAVYIGRLASMKNVETLYKVAGITKNIDFIFIGGEEGSDKHLLQQLSSLSKEEDNNIYYLGAKYGQEKINIMSSADLIIMPSIHEPFGLVALEALSAGQNGKTIFLSSFVDGMGEFLTDDTSIKCGITVVSIKRAINKFLLMSDEEKENMRLKGCELAQKYTWDICTNKIQEVWQKI